jgi:ribosomal protein S18 acetylase RimI-like enzyme
MVRFRDMKADEFTAFRAWSVEDYASSIARNYRIALEDARRSSEGQTAELLPAGLATPNHLFFVLLADSTAEPVGYLWCQLVPDEKRAFVYSIVIHEPYRGQGYGRSALTQLEQLLFARGIGRLGLHVFGDNPRAQALYQRFGYRIIGTSMQKELPVPEGMGQGQAVQPQA